jgi:uncharacterized membrane protein HdeD (DUF308 family)
MPTAIPMEAQTIRKHSTWFTIYGIALIVLGALAILMPNIATLATSIFVGWLLLAGGVFGLVSVIQTGSSAPGFWWNLLTAVLYLLAGATLLWNPVAGVVTLTIVLAAYLLATGVIKVLVAFGYRDAIPGAWLWMLLSAVIDVALGVLIVAGLPGTAAWVLGLMVGINLVFTGMALAVAANCCRSMAATGTGA